MFLEVMNQKVVRYSSIILYIVVVIGVAFYAWKKYTDDELNVYSAYFDSLRSSPEFNDATFVSEVDDCGLGRDGDTNPLIKEFIRLNGKGSKRRSLDSFSDVASVIKSSDLKVVESSKGRLNLSKISNKYILFLSRVAVSKNGKLAIMCVSNGHTRSIVSFRKLGVAQWQVNSKRGYQR